MTARTARPRVGPLASIPSDAPALDVDALLDDPGTGIIVCCGSGGVGKTTTSAALALRAAERGRKVVVLTIDPARRLAQSMGIEELDNTPRPVSGVRKPRGGERGSLDAMMLDMKRTFDEVVESQATPEKAQQILQNPFYIALSSSFAGTQEYMAMEKLGQIHRQAQADGDLRPDRRRHPAVALGARLPRRARAAVELPRRPVHPRAAGAGAGPARLMTAGLSVHHQRAHQGAGRPGAAGHADLRGGVRHALRRLPGPRGEDLRAAPGRGDGVLGGGGARAGRAARGGLLRGAAGRGPDAAGRAGGQPGERAARSSR